MTGIVIRICLRYLAAFLVARGALSPEHGAMISGDADIVAGIELIVGAGMALAVEGWLYLERRYGWNV